MMEFYVLFHSEMSVFFKDSRFGITTDILEAERYETFERAEEDLRL